MANSQVGVKKEQMEVLCSALSAAGMISSEAEGQHCGHRAELLLTYVNTSNME